MSRGSILEFLPQADVLPEGESSVELVLGGEIRHLALSKSVAMTDEAQLEWIVLRDTTEFIRSTAARQEKSRVGEEKRRREWMDRIAGSVAHELNNHTMAIAANAELAEIASLLGKPDEVVSAIESVKASTFQAARLVGQLCDYARQSGLHPELTDVRGPLETALELATSLAERSGVELVIECEIGEPLWVIADRNQLLQLVLNLLRNAIQTCLDDRVEFSFHQQAVDENELVKSLLETTPAPGRFAVLRVVSSRDDLTAWNTRQLFEPSPSIRTKGDALGLAAAAGALAANGGALLVRKHGDQRVSLEALLPLAEA